MCVPNVLLPIDESGDCSFAKVEPIAQRADACNALAGVGCVHCINALIPLSAREICNKTFTFFLEKNSKFADIIGTMSAYQVPPPAVIGAMKLRSRQYER